MKALKLLVAAIAGALLMMTDALYNGYPLFYPDSNTYIFSGMQLYYPADRPIAYGLFIRFFSFNGTSLWLAVFFQSLILAYLILLTVKVVLGEKRFILYGLITILFLSFCTALSWTSSMVLADVFTPIAFLAMFVLIYGNTTKLTRVLLYLIFAIAVSTHLSHLVIFLFMVVFTLVTRKWLIPEIERRKRTIRILGLLLLTICLEIPMRPALDKYKYVAFMGAMVEHHIVQKYLNEYCGTKNYLLCKYKDSLNMDCASFVWSPKSPFSKIGGWTPEVNDEFTDITYATLTKPKYIALHIEASLCATCYQLKSFGINDGTIAFLDKNGLVYGAIQKYFPSEFASFLHTKQNTSYIVGVGTFSNIFIYTEYISLALLLILLAFYRSIFTGIFKTAIILFLVFIVFNSWDLSTFSGVTNHYGAKVAWLLPFLCIMALLKFLEKRNASS